MPDELEELKKRKLEALQRQYQENIQQAHEEEEQIKQQIDALESMIKPRLNKEALARYGNIKAAHPEKAVQLLIVLNKLIQLGKVGMVSDETLKSILQRLTPEKHETKIIRK